MLRIKRSWFLISGFCLAVILLVLYLRPVPSVKGEFISNPDPMLLQNPELPWPAGGQAAYGAVNYGVLAASGQAKPVPIASVAKVMTVLAVLDKKPLAPGQGGPMITITPADVADYQAAKAGGESVLPVSAAEQLTEQQVIQSLLIPSANNMAKILAKWGFGSVENYLTYANQKAKDLGMQSTNFADASGFSPQTTSTASDVVTLGLAALNNPLISAVVNQSTATLPLVGTVKNVNWLLGSDGVVGIKTGNTDQAGGCFLLAAKRSIDGHELTTVSAVLGAQDLASAISQSKSIMLAGDSGFYNYSSSGQAIYKAPWGDSASSQKLNSSILAWHGSAVTLKADLLDLQAGTKTGTYVGAASLENAGYIKTEKLYLTSDLEKPSFWWRIFH